MRLILLLASALLSAGLSAHADTVYTYISPNFTIAYQPYTTNDAVSGSFTLANPLMPNTTNGVLSPTAFSFTDGMQTISQANATSATFDSFSTDSTGAITQYSIGLWSNSGGITSKNVYPALNIGQSSINGGVGSNLEAGWFTSMTVPPPAVTPEPSSLVLLGTGLLALVGAVKRRLS